MLLPSPALSRREQQNPAKSPQTALPLLLAEMARRGASPRRIIARMAGGASMFASLTAPGTINMGERNIVASRNTLMTHGVPLVAEDVGEDYGRTVRFQVCDGRVDISSVAHGSRAL